MFIKDLECSLTRASNENKHTIFPVILISTYLNVTMFLLSMSFCLFYNHNIYPLIDRPTRITPHSATTIDNIFCNVFNHKIKSGVVIANLTDHYPIFQITSSVFHYDNITRNKRIRLFNKKNVDNICANVNHVDWSFVCNVDSPSDAYSTFIKIMDIYNTHFPCKLSRITKSGKRKIPRQPWITSAIVKSIIRKEKLYKKYVNRPTESRKKCMWITVIS